MVSMPVKLAESKPQVSHFIACIDLVTAPACQVEVQMPKGANRSLLLQGKPSPGQTPRVGWPRGFSCANSCWDSQSSSKWLFTKCSPRKSKNLQLVVLLGNLMPTLNVISNGFFGDPMVFIWSLTLSTSHCRYLWQKTSDILILTSESFLG